MFETRVLGGVEGVDGVDTHTSCGEGENNGEGDEGGEGEDRLGGEQEEEKAGEGEGGDGIIGEHDETREGRRQRQGKGGDKKIFLAITSNERVWDAALLACKLARDRKRFEAYLDAMHAAGLSPLYQGTWTVAG